MWWSVPPSFLFFCLFFCVFWWGGGGGGGGVLWFHLFVSVVSSLIVVKGGVLIKYVFVVSVCGEVQDPVFHSFSDVVVLIFHFALLLLISTLIALD